MDRIETLKNTLQSLKKGGEIHIKKENRGKFTSYCGGKVTSECIARGKNSPNPAIRKRATFAANARKWKHQHGGSLIYQMFLPGYKEKSTEEDNNNRLVYRGLEFDNNYNPRYPIETVDSAEIYSPKVEETTSTTQTSTEEPRIETVVTTDINKPSYEINIEGNTTKPEDIQTPFVSKEAEKKAIEEMLNYASGNNENLNQINKELLKAGYKKTQRAAILATMLAESGVNPMAIGDAGRARGLFQWHPNRFTAGKDLASQIQLALSELKDFDNKNAWSASRKYNKRSAFDTFHNTEDLMEAISALTANFIRPANTDKEIQKRYGIAQQLMSQMA